jgi:hypothetical protein
MMSNTPGGEPDSKINEFLLDQAKPLIQDKNYISAKMVSASD